MTSSGPRSSRRRSSGRSWSSPTTRRSAATSPPPAPTGSPATPSSPCADALRPSVYVGGEFTRGGLVQESWSTRMHDVLEGAAASGALSGAVAVVVDREGTQGLAAGGVTRAVGNGRQVEAGDTFRLALMTKALASVAALQLVEQGRLA